MGPHLFATTRVVLTIVDKVEQSIGSVEGFHVFPDRFYSDPELAEALHDKTICLTGTVNRAQERLTNVQLL